jgi:hypothetical protein
MTSHWRIWVNATTKDKALILLNRIAAEIGRVPLVAVASCSEDGGHRITFQVPLESKSWNDAVVELIALGERVGYAWQLMGSILDDPEGRSYKSRVSGVLAIQWSLRK